MTPKTSWGGALWDDKENNVHSMAGIFIFYYSLIVCLLFFNFKKRSLKMHPRDAFFEKK